MTTTESPPLSFGQRVKGYRLLRGMTQTQLAAKAEVIRKTIYLIESGRTKGTAKLNTVRQIAAALKVGIEDLL